MCEGSRMMWRSNMGRCCMLAKQRTAAGGHNLCMKSLAKAYMDLEREYVVIQRRKQDLTLIFYHIENFRVHGV